MMSIWEMLEIDATCDLSAIRKAYARKLKIHHPEDDPKGFQALKEAYDSAIQYAKYTGGENPRIFVETLPVRQESEEDFSVEEFPPFRIREESLQPRQNEDEFPPFPPVFLYNRPAPPVAWENINQEFIRQMDALYADFPSRIRLENWEELLNRDAMWDFENRKRLEPLVLGFLSSHYYLPQNVWKLLDRCFELGERTAQLGSDFNIPFARHVKKLLKQPMPLNFSFIKTVGGDRYDLYLELKENVCDFLKDKDLRAAEDNLDKAKKLCEDDPDLIRLEGIICLRRVKYDLAMELFNQALSSNPEDMEALYYRSYIFFKRNDTHKAIKDLNRVLSSTPSHPGPLLLAAQCYLKVKDLPNAMDSYKRARSIVPEDDDQTRGTLSQVRDNLNSALWNRQFTRPWEFRETRKLLKSLRQPVVRQRITARIFFAKFFKWGLYALILLLCIAAAIGTKIGVIFLLYFLFKAFSSKKKNY